MRYVCNPICSFISSLPTITTYFAQTHENFSSIDVLLCESYQNELTINCCFSVLNPTCSSILIQVIIKFENLRKKKRSIYLYAFHITCIRCE